MGSSSGAKSGLGLLPISGSGFSGSGLGSRSGSAGDSGEGIGSSLDLKVIGIRLDDTLYLKSDCAVFWLHHPLRSG